ncbi:uncharacterized protein PG986_008801 [Apiospora aurea]|uniref:Uncharacterized protein n=1 Tax=Apiospora aurea TaxID=335848 RepID=A0ABR1Q5V3_9PEZI
MVATLSVGGGVLASWDSAGAPADERTMATEVGRQSTQSGRLIRPRECMKLPLIPGRFGGERSVKAHLTRRADGFDDAPEHAPAQLGRTGRMALRDRSEAPPRSLDSPAAHGYGHLLGDYITAYDVERCPGGCSSYICYCATPA